MCGVIVTRCSGSRHDPNTYYVVPTRSPSRQRRGLYLRPHDANEERYREVKDELEQLREEIKQIKAKMAQS